MQHNSHNQYPHASPHFPNHAIHLHTTPVAKSNSLLDCLNPISPFPYTAIGSLRATFSLSSLSSLPSLSSSPPPSFPSYPTTSLPLTLTPSFAQTPHPTYKVTDNPKLSTNTRLNPQSQPKSPSAKPFPHPFISPFTPCCSTPITQYAPTLNILVLPLFSLSDHTSPLHGYLSPPLTPTLLIT